MPIGLDIINKSSLILSVKLAASVYMDNTVWIVLSKEQAQKTINIFGMEISNGNNSSVRNYANTYLPHIQMHLQKADSLANAL